MEEPPPPPKRLRILALHSFRTSASIFEDQLRRAGILTGGGENDDDGASSRFAGVPAAVTFLNAPNAASGPPPPDVVAGRWPPPYREWLAATRIDEEEEGSKGKKEEEGADSERGGGGGCAKATRRQRRYRFLGLEDSERVLSRALREGEYDGIVGFSQGAAMAAAMVAMQLAVRRTGGGVAAAAGAAGGDTDPWAHVRADLAAAPLPSFLICIGAAMAPHSRHLLAFSVAGRRAAGEEASALPLPLPTAHLIGAADPVRPFSERLAAAFDGALVLRHARGHVVPRLDEAQVRRLRGFLSRGGGAGGAAEAKDEEEAPPPPRARL